MGEIQPSGKTFTRQERRQQQREQERQGHHQGTRRSQLKTAAIVLVILIGAGGALFGLLAKSGQDAANGIFDPASVCINESIPLAMHIHPKLRIVISGQQQSIPADIGISGTCAQPLHTHDGSGEIHVESNVVRDFTLGEFFAVWGKPFTKDQILDAKVDATHRMVMTVNGKQSTEYGNLVLRDQDQIEIRLEAR